MLESDYLLSYRTARLHGHSRLGSLHLQLRRSLYARKLKINSRRADRLMAISEHTKQDFEKFLGVSSKKISVTQLGVSEPLFHTTTTPQLHRYLKTSWGYMARPYSMDLETPFLLFVGGVDRRRKITDLVTAFNHLRGQGHKLNLVLSGDIMHGPNSIPVEETRDALKSSSYLEDIIFMGFTDDTTRDWLYRNALAFIYPSRYEGFGLPILEAMIHGCPAICYENSAVREIGGKTLMYAKDAEDIKDKVLLLLSYSTNKVKQIRDQKCCSC